MTTAHGSSSTRRSRTTLLLAAGWALAWAPAVLAAKSDTGEWSQPVNFHPLADQIVHMVLMRSGGDSARVLYWGLNDTNPYLWSVETEAHLRLARSDGLTMGIFCGGHSTLFDGTALISGGTAREALTLSGGALASTSYQSGYKGSFVFDPRSAHLSNHGFTQTRSLALARWYPTNTTLADGKVLVTSGQQYSYSTILGGSISGATVNTMTTIAHNETLFVADRPTGGGTPAAREGHAAVYDFQLKRTLLFGGANALGQAIDDGVYALTRTTETMTPNQDTWTWQQVYGTTGMRPSARHGHAAAYENFGRSMFVVGGDTTGAGNQTWRFWSYANAEHAANIWTREPDLDDAVRGQTVVYVPAAGNEKMLVFGGKSGASRVNTLRSFDLATRQWSIPATTGTPPSARDGHIAIQVLDQKMLVFGGFDGTNYLNDLWELDLTTNPWTWRQGQLGAGTSPPPVRARHGATIASIAYPGVLVVYGGEYRDGNGQLVQRNDVWALHVAGTNGYQWKQPLLDAALPARSRFTIVDDRDAALALTPERFVPSAGGYEALPASANKALFTYALMFALGNNKVFYAGHTDHLDHMDRLLDLATMTWETPTHGVQGTTAVMYRPGKLLKYGGDPTQGTPSYTIDFNGSGTWNFAGSVPEAGRIHHSLVVLPTGKVLLLAGKKPQPDSARRNPYVWDPLSGWSSPLAPEPRARGYHSTALLLPDGRVLSAGGFFPSDTFYQATIFSPPYLFSGDAPATRPVIQSAPRILRFGTPFDLTVPGATSIQSVCLIRPGSATHGFDMNQRYIPLSISNASGSQLSVVAPSDSLTAPLGDYLLFVVDGAGVPSIAKWVRVSSDNAPPAANPLTYQAAVLSWTSPGDDGNASGIASEYDLRYATFPITESNFYYATRMPAPDPHPQGATECAALKILCGSYFFALRTRDDAGNWSDASTVAGTIACGGQPGPCTTSRDDDAGRATFWVAPPRPTPARDRLTIDYTVSQAGRATVTIFDVAGRTIRKLVEASVSAGNHSAVWDLRSDAGRAMPAGIYLVRVAWGARVEETRAVLIE